jgi:hypothetical protein
MKLKSESGQAVIVLVLISVLVFGVVYLGLIANRPGIERGAEAIGDAAGEVIDDMSYNQEAENAILLAQDQMVSDFWLNQQKLVPNKHSVDRHGADAWAATNCYNNNGFFQLWRIDNTEFHGLCQDENNVVRDVILKRRSNNSNEFDFVNAFTPKDGWLKQVIYWIRGKGGQMVAPPNNVVIYVDGVIP